MLCTERFLIDLSPSSPVNFSFPPSPPPSQPPPLYPLPPHKPPASPFSLVSQGLPGSSGSRCLCGSLPFPSDHPQGPFLRLLSWAFSVLQSQFSLIFPVALCPPPPPPILPSLTSLFWVLISQPHPLLRLSQLSATAGGCPRALCVLITFSDRLDSRGYGGRGAWDGIFPHLSIFFSISLSPFWDRDRSSGRESLIALSCKQLLDLFSQGQAGSSCSSPRAMWEQLGPPLFSRQSPAKGTWR